MAGLPRSAYALALAAALALPWAAAAEETALLRGHLRLAEGPRGTGCVFLLPAAGDELGVVAVGAAHSFDPAQLVEAGEVEFRRAKGGERISVSSRYFSAPGRPFHEPGATLVDDYVIFALDLAPEGVRVLAPAAEPAREGARVRILGIPSDGARDQIQVFGTLARVAPTRLEVDLDVPADLRGWGGAPVLDAEGGGVVGMLQAAWPSADRLRVGVSPIAGVVEALAGPLDAGRGRPFAAFADDRVPPFARRAAGREAAQAERGTEPEKPGAGESGGRPAEAAAAPAPRPPAAGAKSAGATGVQLRMEIEHPANDAVVGNAAGAFLAGRAVALTGEFKRFDVVLVLDTSGSTSAPTGVDVDEDGVVGSQRLGIFGGALGLASTDEGDSILAAEVAAARRLLQGLDPRNTRVAVVTFAGEPEASQGFFSSGRVYAAAMTAEPLTTDFAVADRSLQRVRERGPSGMTHMAAGVDQATIELLGLQGSLSKPDPASDKVVLFFTDGAPTLPYQGFEADNVRAVLRAAQRARRAGVRIHSFAIGPEALAGPVAPVEMASITDGIFTPVRHPGGLVNVIEGVSFANIEEVRVRNATTGEDAHEVRSHADGSWDALVPLATGKNRIEVTARASDGAEASDSVTVHYAPGAADPFVPRELVMKRNELLEARLIELRRDRLDAERGRVEEMRRELALEIERERAAAAESAARQRKELDLDVETDPDAASP